MKNTIKKINDTASNHIKVKLDAKTFIVLQRMSSLKIWKLRYPGATIIS